MLVVTVKSCTNLSVGLLIKAQLLPHGGIALAAGCAVGWWVAAGSFTLEGGCLGIGSWLV